MELSINQINLLKQRELELFIEFIKVCEILNINYFVLGGTLLGAVRHQGFIPWDDDIDVGMFRNDFETFRNKGIDLLPKWCFLQDCYNDKNIPYSFIKIRDKNSVFIESSVSNFDINHGVFIDVFPLDYYPDKKIRKLSVDFINTILTHRVNLLFKFNKHSGFRKTEDVILKLLFPNYRLAVKLRDKFYRSVSRRPSQFVRNYCGAWALKEIVPTSYFAGIKKIEFEGIYVSCPLESEKYLTAIYGDYLKLPPLDKRIPHHNVVKFEIK